MPNTTTVRIPTTTPKGKAVKDAGKDLPAAFLTDVKDAAQGGTMKGADLAALMVAHGLLADLGPKGNKDARSRNGLVIRTYMRSHGAYVGQGRTYGMTFAEARDIAAGYVAKVTPPKGVRYAKGRLVVKDEAEGQDEA